MLNYLCLSVVLNRGDVGRLLTRAALLREIFRRFLTFDSYQ